MEVFVNKKAFLILFSCLGLWASEDEFVPASPQKNACKPLFMSPQKRNDVLVPETDCDEQDNEDFYYYTPFASQEEQDSDGNVAVIWNPRSKLLQEAPQEDSSDQEVKCVPKTPQKRKVKRKRGEREEKKEEKKEDEDLIIGNQNEAKYLEARAKKSRIQLLQDEFPPLLHIDDAVGFGDAIDQTFEFLDQVGQGWFINLDIYGHRPGSRIKKDFERFKLSIDHARGEFVLEPEHFRVRTAIEQHIATPDESLYLNELP